jgi:hypothetical protein
MKNEPLIALVFLLCGACAPLPQPPAATWVNPAHLAHLYQEVRIGEAELGTVWIYCEAPDYHLVGDADEGFTCVDDVARALVFYCRAYAVEPSEAGVQKIRGMTNFLLYMQAENGFFYNFLLPGPQINTTHRNSQAVPNWWSWRAFWALSELQLLQAPELADLQLLSRPAMDTLVQKMQGLCLPGRDSVVFEGMEVPACLVDLGADQAGLILMGLANVYQVRPSAPVKSLMLTLGNLLLRAQYGDADTWPHAAILSWRNHWHAWGNSQSYALLRAGRVLGHEPFLQAGLKEVRFFYPYCLEKGLPNGFSVVREPDSLRMTDLQPFPQIAYNLRPMIFASLEAYAVTGDTTFAHTAAALGSWFLGNNPAHQAMYDPSTGRAFDGIGAVTEVNRNAGAESTIEALLSLQALESVPQVRTQLLQLSKMEPFP